MTGPRLFPFGLNTRGLRPARRIDGSPKVEEERRAAAGRVCDAYFDPVAVGDFSHDGEAEACPWQDRRTPPERLKDTCAVFGLYAPAMIYDFDHAIHQAHDDHPSGRFRADGVVDHVGQSAEQGLSVASDRHRDASSIELDLAARAIRDRRAIGNDIAEKLRDLDQFVHCDVALAEPGDGHELFDQGLDAGDIELQARLEVGRRQLIDAEAQNRDRRSQLMRKRSRRKYAVARSPVQFAPALR